MAEPSVTRKRIRRDPETTRGLILDVTETLMVEEGYAAVSSRRIAQELGLNAATVHYYYPTTDDIFIDLHRRMMDRQLRQFDDVMASAAPLAAFWQLQSGGAQAALGVEFLALANHRKAIRDRLAGATDEARAAQSQRLAAALGNLKVDPAALDAALSACAPPPAALATILVAIGRLLANEERVGITAAHDDVRGFVDRMLAVLEQGRGAGQS